MMVDAFGRCTVCGSSEHMTSGGCAKCSSVMTTGEVQYMYEDPMHPNGRCTCAGEGQCAWCLKSELVELAEEVRKFIVAKEEHDAVAERDAYSAMIMLSNAVLDH